MGLNTVDGGSTSNVTYYGANWLRNNVVLAPNAVVLLNGLCYSAGNAEPGMAIPNWDIAHQRVDNFAAGFLGAGAKAVFAYAWQTGAHVVKMLFTTNKTMEQIFTTPGAHPHPSYGFINWDARRLKSVRTPGTVNYLDPHAKEGFYRAASGWLGMTASEWKGGQAQVDPTPPVLSNLEAVGSQTTVALQGTTPALFTPNGDGLSDSLVMSHTVSEGAFIDFEVLNGSGTVVRRFTTWSEAGTGRSSWNGKKDNGTYVADGSFTVKATPRDGAGNVGDPATLDVQVLTTMRAPTAAPALFFARDGDALAASAALGVTLTTDATLSWKVVDRDGNLVRRHLDADPTSAGPQTWAWDGRNELGEYVPDGTYFSVVTANTAAGKYSHKVAVQTGAFAITSPVTSASRGQQVKFVIFSAEPLASRPRLRVTQPGLATYTVDTVKVATQKYRAVFTFKSGGTAGTVQLVAVAPDVNGVKQSTAATFPLN
jgi:flagellar hook assembly protein FlgD